MIKGWPLRLQLGLVGLCSLGSGAALVATILIGLPLWSTLLVFGVGGVLVTLVVWQTLPMSGRSLLAIRARSGLMAGAVATVAYDAWRYAVVKVFSLEFWPFESFVHFGRSIIGKDASDMPAYMVGTGYHCINGLLFGLAYALLFGPAHPVVGVLFAMALEAVVLALYPGWLHIDALRGEFTAVSISGHLVFGLVLGALTVGLLRLHSANKPSSR